MVQSAANGKIPLQTESPKNESRNGKRRFKEPQFVGKRYPRRYHRGFTLIGNLDLEADAAGNDRFFIKVREALDLIGDEAPFYFSLLRSINEDGERVIFYTGKNGPASFNAWEKDYIVRITATHMDARLVFDNNPYYLAATLIHELVGHGRQASDGRLWALYDWCGNDVSKLPGVILVTNRLGGSSGLVEYEANLFARGFLETVQSDYPNYNERVIKRFLRVNKFLERRFPGWYDADKATWTMIKEFESRFRRLCPGQTYTSPPIPTQ